MPLSHGWWHHSSRSGKASLWDHADDRKSSHPLGRSNNSIGNKNLQFYHPAWQHVTSFMPKKIVKKQKAQTKLCRLCHYSNNVSAYFGSSTSISYISQVLMCLYIYICIYVHVLGAPATAFLVGFLKLLSVASSPQLPCRAAGGPKSEWQQHLWSVCHAILLQLQLLSRRWRRGPAMRIYGFQVATRCLLPR